MDSEHPVIDVVIREVFGCLPQAQPLGLEGVPLLFDLLIGLFLDRGQLILEILQLRQQAVQLLSLALGPVLVANPAQQFLQLALHDGVRLGRKTHVIDLAGGNRRTDYGAVSNTVIGVVLLITGTGLKDIQGDRLPVEQLTLDPAGKTLTFRARGRSWRCDLGTYALSAGYYDAYYGRASKVRTLIKQDFLRAFETVDISFVCLDMFLDDITKLVLMKIFNAVFP